MLPKQFGHSLPNLPRLPKLRVDGLCTITYNSGIVGSGRRCSAMQPISCCHKPFQSRKVSVTGTISTQVSNDYIYNSIQFFLIRLYTHRFELIKIDSRNTCGFHQSRIFMKNTSNRHRSKDGYRSQINA